MLEFAMCTWTFGDFDDVAREIMSNVAGAVTGVLG